MGTPLKFTSPSEPLTALHKEKIIQDMVNEHRERAEELIRKQLVGFADRVYCRFIGQFEEVMRRLPGSWLIKKDTIKILMAHTLVPSSQYPLSEERMFPRLEGADTPFLGGETYPSLVKEAEKIACKRYRVGQEAIRAEELLRKALEKIGTSRELYENSQDMYRVYITRHQLSGGGREGRLNGGYRQEFLC